MSVLIEFAMFPTDKGDSVSKFVAPLIKNIKGSGFPYHLTAMGTIIETNSIDEALDIINESYKILEPDSQRVYSTITLDIQKGKKNRLIGKVRSIEEKLK